MKTLANRGFARRGFTLIDIVIVIVILFILSLVVMAMFKPRSGQTVVVPTSMTIPTGFEEFATGDILKFEVREGADPSLCFMIPDMYIVASVDGNSSRVDLTIVSVRRVSTGDLHGLELASLWNPDSHKTMRVQVIHQGTAEYERITSATKLSETSATK